MTLVDYIEENSPGIIEEYKEKLLAKVHDLLEDNNIDENRLLMEVTIFADKICVDEEIVRLQSHYDGPQYPDRGWQYQSQAGFYCSGDEQGSQYHSFQINRSGNFQPRY